MCCSAAPPRGAKQKWQPQLLPPRLMTTCLGSMLLANCFYPMLKHRCHFCKIQGSSDKWLWLKDTQLLGQNFLATVQELKTLLNQTFLLLCFPGVRLLLSPHTLLPSFSSFTSAFSNKSLPCLVLFLPSASRRTSNSISILDPMLVLVQILDCSHGAAKKWFLHGPDSKAHTFPILF